MKGLVAILLLMSVAGCAHVPAAAPEAAAPAPTSGDLRGFVFDAGIHPLAGATVTVSEGTRLLRTNTTSSGSWNFTGLSLGAHFLTAGKVGYLTRQATAQVAPASEPVRMVLESDVSYRAPYMQPYEFHGIIQCGAVVNAPMPVGFAAVAVCNVPNEQLGQPVTQDTFMAQQSLDGGKPTWVQCDLVWDSTQPAGDQLLLYMDEINTTGAGSGGPGSPTSAKFTELTSSRGPSPLVAHLDGKEVDRLGRGFDLQVRVFSWTADPIPAGVTLQQPFTVYTAIFYGYAPPAGWTFADGNPAPPA